MTEYITHEGRKYLDTHGPRLAALTASHTIQMQILERIYTHHRDNLGLASDAELVRLLTHAAHALDQLHLALTPSGGPVQ